VDTLEEGLNVIENWNSANDFIWYGKGGEIATNNKEEQEIAILALHLLQICLVYINTLLVQKVLAEKEWLEKMGYPLKAGHCYTTMVSGL
jgi:TnpA family transposase